MDRCHFSSLLALTALTGCFVPLAPGGAGTSPLTAGTQTTLPPLVCVDPPAAATPSAVLTVADAAGSLVGVMPQEQAGGGLAAVGDLDGDGLNDLAIGAPHNSELAPDGGKVYFAFGRNTGWTPGESLAGTPSVVGDVEDMEIAHVVGLGDATGDGLADVAISPGYHNVAPPGGQYLIKGRSTGWTSSLGVGLADAVSLNSQADGSTDLATRQAVGDVDGDGLADWLMWGQVINSGEAIVVSGAQLKPSLTVPADAILWVYGGNERVYFSGLGDYDNDGYDDVLGWGVETGVIYVARGGSSGLPFDTDMASAASTTFRGSDGHALDGLRLVGDLDGDGLQDLVLQKYSGANRGAHLFFGRTSWPAEVTELDADVAIGGGYQVYQATPLGDLDGDGLGDLGVTGPCSDPDSATDAYLYFGRTVWPSSLDLSEASVHIAPGAGLDWIARVATERGDLDGDGIDDLILATPNDGNGQVILFRGRSTWDANLSTDHAEVRLVGSMTYESMGTWLAVTDLDGDGADDLVTASPVHPLNSAEGEVFVFPAPLR